MNFINDIILVNRVVLGRTLKNFKNNWIILFSGIIYTTLNIILVLLINTLFSGVLSLLAGLAIAIVTSSLISNYLYLLFNIVNYDRISWQIFKDGFKHFLWKIYGIFFIAWLANLIFSSIGEILGIGGYQLYIIINIIVIIGLNPLPETLYIKYFTSGESIKYAFDFMKENWINWLLPNGILYILLYLLTNTWILNIFTTHINIGGRININTITMYLIAQGLFSFTMIYRGHLFKLLSTSTPRKRMYMNRFFD